MTSRKSSGSIPVESAVEPTRSANITVTWRRSASSRGLDSDPGASGGAAEAAAPSWAIARSNLRRSPRCTTPSSSLRSWSVRSGRIEKSIRCSAKRCAYSDSPSEVSHSLTDVIALCVPAHEVVYASVQPFEVRASGHAGEGGAFELACRSLSKRHCRLLRPFDASTVHDHLTKPQHLARQATLARSRQEAGHPCLVRALGVAERTREQQGPFAFPEIAVDFLAVLRNVSFEVQNIVGDLEGEPKQVAEPIESIETAIL